MLEILILDDEVQENIKKLIQYAELNVVPYAVMIDMYNKMKNKEPITPIGDDPNHFIYIPMDIRIAYSIEEHPVGECKHISISTKNGEPNFNDVALIMSYFGFRSDLNGGLATCQAYMENYVIDDVEYSALNIIEPNRNF